MKRIRNIAIMYTILMAGVFCVIWKMHHGMRFTMAAPDTYTDEQLQIYKQIWNVMSVAMEQYQGRMFQYVLLLWVIMLLVGYLLLFCIWQSEIRPILELQRYATEIAKGNLDVKLPMRKNSSFVAFTESFDLMREELKASRQREMEAENAKRQMAAELSHDLKTPIATIQATCELLQMQILKAKKTQTSGVDEISGLDEKIGCITKKAATINELVQSVLHATIDDLEEIKVEVGEYGSPLIVDFFKDLKEYGNIILENAVPECLIYMDKLRMEQVIDNVVGNSYKYAHTDIRVSFDETEEILMPDGKKSRFLRITIKDSGPGVAPEELPLLVEKYYRGSNAKEQNGYGLGMYLVKWYMEKQGGGMEYYNDDGFTVDLLVKKVS